MGSFKMTQYLKNKENKKIVSGLSIKLIAISLRLLLTEDLIKDSLLT